MESFRNLDLMNDYLDINDLSENLEFYRDLMNLRELEVIFKHEKLIEKELYLFLTGDLPEYIPFFNYIKYEFLEQYKDEINNCKLINLENLDISPKTMKDINSIFLNNAEYSKSKNKNKSGLALNKNKSKDNSNMSLSKESDRLKESTILTDEDFKLKDTIEEIKYEPYIADNDIIGNLFESDIINYVYDFFYILSSGKVNMMRNKEYTYNNTQYELDFQIVNLNLKYFLYFIALLYPNISNIKTLDLDIANIFKGEENIFEKIDKLVISGKLKEFEYIDILGEVTIDYLNINHKKELQFEKYKSLVEILNKKPNDNKLFKFIEKNKKIIIIITNGKYEQFYLNFKKNNNINIPSNKTQINNNDINSNIIINDNNNKNINYLFIYVNKKTDECKILREKIIFNYISLLEKELEGKTKNEDKEKEITNENKNEIKNKEEYENKIEENKKEENKQIINKYKCLKLSEINENFYEKINASRKLESFRKCLKKINNDFIIKLPSLFFKYIKDNIKFDNYEEELKRILNIQFKNQNEIYEKLNNLYQNEKDKYIINISLYELSDSKFYFFEKYHDDKIKIINYKGKEVNKNYDKTFSKDIEEWFNNNIKSKNLINIIIMNFTKYNKYITTILSKLNDSENKQNYILFYKKELSELIQDAYEDIEGIIFEQTNDILKNKIIELKAKKQYMQRKIYLFINYVDKLLKNKIIINKDENEINNNNYLNELAIKINQDLSIYYNYDISKYNENVIDLKKLIKLINEIYSNIDVSQFKNKIINSIIERVNKKLLIYENDNIVLQSKVINIYKIKFDNAQLIFDNMFYKYFLKKYIQFKRVIKETLINNFLNNFHNNG